MNPEQELIFAYLEEDNTQRAYFRARPILTVNGDIREEANKSWPNEGCLRIVPDKNEQHTFKERMRALGAWCMLDLTGYSPEANKIRTNKNYRPAHGEVNQFILYSDAVKALPETVFYEVLDGKAADHTQLAEQAITPRFYIRDDDTLYGPVNKGAAAEPAPAAETEATLYELTLPDEKQHVMLCIAAENKITERPAAPVRTKPVRVVPDAAAPAPVEEAPAAPAPKKAAEDEALPIGQALNILDQSMTFEETLQGIAQPLSSEANLLHQQPAQSIQAPYLNKPAAPLTGTPLYRAPLHTATPQPKNKLQEVVSNQVRVVRNDPPAEPLPTGARLTQVENPVEAACQSLKTAWQLSDSRRQLASFIMSLDGIRAHLAPGGSQEKQTPLYRAIQLQLQDLEAERLSALVQLDQAKADADVYRKSVLDNASAQAKAELERLEDEQASLTGSIEELKSQLNLLIAQREEQAAQIDALKQNALPETVAKLLADAGMQTPAVGQLLRLAPAAGDVLTADQLLARAESAIKTNGLTFDRNRAIAFLTLLAVSNRIGITTNAPAAAATLTNNLINAMGWQTGYAHQVTMEQRPIAAAAPADGTPAVLLTSLAHYAPVEGLCKLLMARSGSQLVRNAAYDADPWPVFPLVQLPFIAEAETAGKPVAAASLAALLEHPAETAVVETAMKPILDAVAPLSGHAYKTMVRFAAACAGTMDGGLAAACDWATLLWILPAVDHNPRYTAVLKPLLAEYPLSDAAL